MSVTAQELAERVGGVVVGDSARRVSRAAGIEEAGPRDVAFVRSADQVDRLASTRAGVVVVPLGSGERVGAAGGRVGGVGVTLIEHRWPEFAFVSVLRLFDPTPGAEAGVHPTAVVHPTARVDPTASVGPHAVIQAGAVVGARAVIHSGVVIGARCVVGEGSIIQANVVIGTDGFGYVADPVRRVPVRVPHVGHVEIGREVEIGANSTIDRGKLGATVIGDFTKIDNLCHVAHNCKIGRGCLICGQCALSGSVTLEDGVTLAGSVGVADNLRIGAGATIAARSGVSRDVPAGETWFGYPAHPASEAKRNYAALRHLAEMLSKFRRLEKLRRTEGE